ncbi:MAG: MFS transporter [Chloroflexi bacterium]|jgi:MFS family permease|nr:MFS transporter [Chloroflexota bacterium]
MTSKTGPYANVEVTERTSWLPLMIILLAQLQMAINVSALPISIGAIVDELNTSPTSVSTALVVYSLAVAGFVILGARLGKLIGSRLVFQIGVLVHGFSMGAAALSTTANDLIQYQGLAGLAAAALVPTLVVLIVTHYEGEQQTQSLGVIGGAQALASLLAFPIIGVLISLASWRYAFGLLVFVAAVVFILSFRLGPVPRQRGTVIDWIGAVIAATAIILISLGFNNLNEWGLLLASNRAPFSILGLSPAPAMVVLGLVFGRGFLDWSQTRIEGNKAPLLELEVLDSRQERAAVLSMLIVAALGAGITFLIPLYIQIVQGGSSLRTSVAVVPYMLAVFSASILVVRVFLRWTARRIGSISFLLVAAGLVILAFAIVNDWGNLFVILGLIVTGIGEGALLTLLFAVMVSASPPELAGDVGALRGTTNNLATGLGTAIAGALLIGMLGVLIHTNLIDNPLIPRELKRQVNLNNIDFISNDQLLEVMQSTTATPEQVNEAVRINTSTRLLALKVTFLVMAGMALIGFIPARDLPNTRAGESSYEKSYEKKKAVVGDGD